MPCTFSIGAIFGLYYKGMKERPNDWAGGRANQYNQSIFDPSFPFHGIDSEVSGFMKF